jgi:hypothetical protein
MSKIGNWVVDLQQRKADIKYTNPYDRHSSKESKASQYYVDYTRYRNQH